jgi:hypothetical protein
LCFVTESTATNVLQTLGERLITIIAFYAAVDLISQLVHYERLLQGNARLFSDSITAGSDFEILGESFERAAQEEAILK